MGLMSELRRRNVLRMVVLYAVAAWLVMQVAEVVIGLANLPDWIGPTILALLAIGFPIALALSWFYELTPEGISSEKDIESGDAVRRTPARRADLIVIALLAAAVIMFAWDKWWTTGPPNRSIAVLAFENMSDDPDQEYFSDGISEELLNLLAKIPELHVTSRTSAFLFKGQDVDIPSVARQLNVAHVLEGSVRKAGDRVRVTAQLIDAKSDSHLWSDTYDRDLDDIFAVQEEIAAAISRQLKVELVRDSDEKGPPRAVRTASTDAYDAYLKGREYMSLRDVESVWRAGMEFERALRLDMDFAPAHAQLAIATLLATGRSDIGQWEYNLNRARQHLDRALELSPDLADGHGGRALLALEEQDPGTAIEHANKALAANPSFVDAMNWLQLAYSYLGRYEESDDVVERMVAIDPLTVVGRINLINRLNWTGRSAEAHEVADRLFEQSPMHAYDWHARTSLYFEGNVADALSWGLKAGRESGYDYSLAWQALALVGEYDEVLRLYSDAQSLVDSLEGRWDEAIAVRQAFLRAYPHIEHYNLDAGDAYYLARRFQEAVESYDRFFDAVPRTRLNSSAPARGPLFESFPVIRLMRLAHARRETGDEEGALAVARIARDENAVLRAAGRENNNRDLAEAMIAAFDGHPEDAIAAIRSAIRNGVRLPQTLDEPVFDNLRDKPEYESMRVDLNALAAREHERVLQLICVHNPTPDHWQPLPETCAGVTE